jgi:hypothetical protein
VTREVRLFNKNVTFRQPVRVSMGGDVCPVPVLETPVQRSQELVNGGSNYNSLKVAKCLAV